MNKQLITDSRKEQLQGYNRHALTTFEDLDLFSTFSELELFAAHLADSREQNVKRLYFDV